MATLEDTVKTVVLMRARPSQADGYRLINAEGESVGEPQPALFVQVRDIRSHKDLSDLQRDPDVEAAAPSMPIRLIGMGTLSKPVPIGTREAVAWGVKAVGAVDSRRTGSGVKVAVLDSGLNMEHPAFKNQGIKFTPRNFLDGDPEDVTDNDGHGTHCAATIFGRDVDKMRIGVAKGVTEVLIGMLSIARVPRWTGSPRRSPGLTWRALTSCRCLLASISKRI